MQELLGRNCYMQELLYAGTFIKHAVKDLFTPWLVNLQDEQENGVSLRAMEIEKLRDTTANVSMSQSII